MPNWVLPFLQFVTGTSWASALGAGIGGAHFLFFPDYYVQRGIEWWIPSAIVALLFTGTHSLFERVLFGDTVRRRTFLKRLQHLNELRSTNQIDPKLHEEIRTGLVRRYFLPERPQQTGRMSGPSQRGQRALPRQDQ